MADKQHNVKGRRTIRKADPTAPIGNNPMKPTVVRPNPEIRLWSFEAKPGSTLARLESAYLASLGAVDATEGHKSAALKSGRFTDAGAVEDSLGFAINQAVPTFKRGRETVAAARREAAELRNK